MDEYTTIIEKNGFWFVDIPRTSSSSLRYELGSKFGELYGKSNVIDKKFSTPQVFKDHVSAQEMRSILGDSVWKNIFTFTIVRNPFDRILSMFNYRKKIGKIDDWNFEDYIVALGRSDQEISIFRYHAHRYSASDFFLDRDGEIIVDFVGKYENRTQDLKFISSKIGLSDLGSVVIQKASPEQTHYSEFYNSKTKDIIFRLYAKDFELFEYEF